MKSSISHKNRSSHPFWSLHNTTSPNIGGTDAWPSPTSNSGGRSPKSLLSLRPCVQEIIDRSKSVRLFYLEPCASSAADNLWARRRRFLLIGAPPMTLLMCTYVLAIFVE